MELTVAGETVELRAERAVVWGKTLLVADLHWGKSASFRAWGLPVPDELAADLARLAQLVVATGVDRILVLGDLIHARSSVSEDVRAQVGAFRRDLPVDFVLVKGNHDRHVDTLPADWGVEVVAERHEGPFVFRHVPGPASGYLWAGHLHPGITVGRGVRRLRLPCFHLGSAHAVLPAFGGFTGTAAVRPEPGDVVVVIAPGGDSGPDRLYRLPRFRRKGENVDPP